MFDRHQAEMTVMQFTDHSLPVHQSMTVHGILSCPILSAKSTNAIFSHNSHRNASLPSGASLWNGMFVHHQAEITITQFTGHSLPVHQSTSVPWDFYLVPFFQPSPPMQFLPITAIGMCHFLPVHHFGMACLAVSKVNIQYLIIYISIYIYISFIIIIYVVYLLESVTHFKISKFISII